MKSGILAFNHPEARMPDFNPPRSQNACFGGLKMSYFGIFRPFLGLNEPFRLFSHHILWPTGHMHCCIPHICQSRQWRCESQKIPNELWAQFFSQHLMSYFTFSSIKLYMWCVILHSVWNSTLILIFAFFVARQICREFIHCECKNFKFRNMWVNEEWQIWGGDIWKNKKMGYPQFKWMCAEWKSRSLIQ